MEKISLKATNILVICILSLQFLGLSFIVSDVLDVSADTVGPEISNVCHSPKYPIYPESVVVYATVIDTEDGVDSVNLSYCDEIMCFFPIPMTRIGTSNVYTATIPAFGGWGNGTEVEYEIIAYDNSNNPTTSEKFHFFFVSAINVSSEIESPGYVGDTIILKGSAIYNGNVSARAETSQVTVDIYLGNDLVRTISDETTDIDGNISVELTFDRPGEYRINTTVTNRTLSGYNETTITIIGITYLSEKLEMTTCYPNQEMHVTGAAKYSNGEPVINSDMEVRINETLFWTGKTDSKGNYSILITAPFETDEYDVNVSVVNRSMICYNETSLSVTDVPLPDLTLYVDEITFIPTHTPPLVNENLNISAVVHNSGSAHCSDVAVHFYNGTLAAANLLGTCTLTKIEYGSSALANITWKPTSNGTFSILVVLDPLGAITESFEDNNNASKALFVDRDFDGDFIGDSVDPDDDEDGYNDVDDAFPYDPNEWVDTDSDGIGNNADDDDDDDGLLDTEEAEMGTDPLDPDSDDDGVKDDVDYDPLDPEVTEKPSPSFPWIWVLLLVVIVIVVLILVIFLSGKFKKGKKEDNSDNPTESLNS
ncbi:MAG: hypothetical protein JSV56_08405 [Methanomassiliicoccales archaeon]|nr:MAG: hypothetical protein JSV56_08405 [Methanomassiliicoccales archaeon]